MSISILTLLLLLPSPFFFLFRRDRDGRKDGGSGSGRDAPPDEDMSSSLLDMDTSKLYAQVTPWMFVFLFVFVSMKGCEQTEGKIYSSLTGHLSLRFGSHTSSFDVSFEPQVGAQTRRRMTEGVGEEWGGGGIIYRVVRLWEKWELPPHSFCMNC